MNDSAIAGSVNEAASSGRPRASETILYGGLAVGVLDISDAITFFGIKYDMTPVHVLQPVVGGLLRRDTLNGGLKTALLGLLRRPKLTSETMRAHLR